jgi:CNT family concentrative nucleoside transporter
MAWFISENRRCLIASIISIPAAIIIAYADLTGLPDTALPPGSRMIMVYALCGFADPGSLGIMIGGMGAMAPERRDEIVALGFRSTVAGTMAACMTGAIVGLFL